MTNEEILIAIIKQAEKNGWEREIIGNWGKIATLRDIQFPDGYCWVSFDEGNGRRFNIFSLIFNHDFAKAFWNKKHKKCILCRHTKRCKEIPHTENDFIYEWQYHLQKIAIEKPEDRLKYFEKFLNDTIEKLSKAGIIGSKGGAALNNILKKYSRSK